MKLVPQTAPYIRKSVSVKRMMLDVIVALMPVTLFAVIQNGWGAIYVLLISLVTMILTELVAHGIMHWPEDMKVKEIFTKEGFLKLKSQYTINNITASVISGLIYALILPAHCNWYVVFMGALFGMLFGKMVFGGLGSNIFNPAAVGRIFAGICFGSQISEAYEKSEFYNVLVQGTVNVSGTPLVNWNYTLQDIFLGQIPGCMGEVSALMILIGAVYLFARRSGDLRSALSYFLSFAIIMLVATTAEVGFVSYLGTKWLSKIFAGGALFGAVYMITDPITSPTTKFGRILYGILAGCITALIRTVGSYPEGVAFSILIVNMVTPTIDYFMRGKPNTYTWKQIVLATAIIVAVGAIVAASILSNKGGW
jgi:electron transport complex protein RnfD